MNGTYFTKAPLRDVEVLFTACGPFEGLAKFKQQVSCTGFSRSESDSKEFFISNEFPSAQFSFGENSISIQSVNNDDWKIPNAWPNFLKAIEFFASSIVACDEEYSITHSIVNEFDPKSGSAKDFLINELNFDSWRNPSFKRLFSNHDQIMVETGVVKEKYVLGITTLEMQGKAILDLRIVAPWTKVKPLKFIEELDDLHAVIYESFYKITEGIHDSLGIVKGCDQ